MSPEQRRAAKKLSRTQSDSRREQQSTFGSTVTELWEAGLQHHQAGRLAEAEACYRLMLAAQPNHAEAYSNLGSALRDQGKLNEAVAAYCQAIGIKPDLAEAHSNLGSALRDQGKLNEAVAAYCQAISIKPSYAEAYSNLGNALKKQGKLDEAIAAYRQAISIKPGHAGAYANLGNALTDQGKLDEAIAAYRQAISIKPDLAGAYANLGNALRDQGRLDEAVAACRQAICIKPDLAEAHSNLGNALTDQGKLDGAVAAYRQAIGIKPDFAEAYSNRGNALQELRRFEDALASHDRALELRPDLAVAHCNRGSVLSDMARFEEALTSYDRALSLRPDFAEAHCNRGNTLKDVRRFEDALASYDCALKLRPDFANAHFNAALCRLLIGDFAGGWQEYEWRWEHQTRKAAKRNFSQPLWLGGNDIAGKTILLHAEQGFGDTLQFSRYVPRVAERGARVVLEVPNALRELMSTLPCAVQIVSRGDALPAFDLHCPLLTLPLAFGTRLETIPSRTPYLSAAGNKQKAWRDRLGRHEAPRIGLVWAGNSGKHLPRANRFDRLRSLQFDQLAPILQVRGCEFYSLQKGDDAVAQLHNSTLLHGVIDWSAEFQDFSDTAAFIENLDLVISVDTSVAHLAGALGKPFWLLNRYNTCWRWLLDREDSPWYPTARLFRQDATREWVPAIARITAALQDYVRNF
jgi:tetratricopeptide (TPR) repeat protein